MTLFSGWLASPEPDAAVEITTGRVAALTLGGRSAAPVVAAYASEPLPPGAVVSSLTGQNIVDQAAVVAALRRTLERLDTRVARIALVVPDPIAKVSLVRFERVPSAQDDLEQLVRWQVRKGVPFSIDEARVTFTPGAHGESGAEFVVAVARTAAIQEYETVCDAAGVHAGRIDLATLSLVNLCLASGAGSGDWLLVHMRPDYASLVIMRGDAMILFRSRGEEDGGEVLGDVVHQTTMYYQDRLSGSGFARVFLAGEGREPGDSDQARLRFEARLGVHVEALDLTRAVAFVDGLAATAAAEDALAPMLGILLRSRQAVPA
jgi:hypothetical protein